MVRLIREGNRRNEFYINNYDEVVDELSEIMRDFDKERNNYQTDVYIYFDDSMNGTLDTFTNVGGNSWLDDDHYVLYSDKPHYDDDNFSAFQTIQDLAYALDMSEDELIEQAYMASDLAEDGYDLSDVDYSDVREYIKHNDELSDRLTDAYCGLIDDEFYGDYIQAAQQVVDEFIERQNEYNSTDYT